MSPIGSPDFGQNPSTNPTAPSYDTGEDTTRLLMGGGSSARSGRWIFATGFEEGALPFLGLSNSNPALGHSGLFNSQTFQGIASLQLRPEALNGATATLNKGFVYPTSTYGYEFQLFTQGSNPEIEILVYSQGNGVNQDRYRFCKLNIVVSGSSLASVYRYTDSVTPVLIGQFPTGGLFRLFKIVYDVKNNIIKRLYFGSSLIEINEPGYEIITAPILAENVNIQIRVTNKNTTENQFILMDNFIITADEP